VALVYRDDATAGKLQITAQRTPERKAFPATARFSTSRLRAKAKGTGAISIAVPGARNSKNQPMDVLGSQTTVTVN